MNIRLALLVALSIAIILSGLAACAEQQPPNTEPPQNDTSVTPEPEPILEPEPKLEPLDPALFISETSAQEAIAVIEQCLISLKNNDIEAFKSAYWHGDDFSLPKEGYVFSLEIESIEVDWEETAGYRDRYTGSELAEHNGWSDEYLLHNFIVVHAVYTVDYDNTKVPSVEGHLSHYLFLTRESENSPWKIWDSMTPWELPVDSDA